MVRSAWEPQFAEDEKREQTASAELPSAVIGWVLASVEYALRNGEPYPDLARLVNIGVQGWQWASGKR